VALSQKVTPRRYALGAAAALAQIDPTVMDSPKSAPKLLNSIWEAAKPSGPDKQRVLSVLDEALAN